MSNQFNELEFTDTGALIQERYFLPDVNHYISDCNNKCLQHIYSDAYTALYGNELSGYLLSYCEGDICLIHCKNNDIYHAEKQVHINYHKEG